MSKTAKRGLPAGKNMRHDAHYIDEIISRPAVETVGRFLPITAIEPNPLQPRTEIGDLTELTASIKDKGVLEPLLVQPQADGKYLIIAGERRWRAATAAGLSQVPCIELEIDERAVAEIALIENLQRKDLTAWEEAEGLLALCQRFGYTHEEVARKIGKSRTSVTESLSIAALPSEVKEKCRAAGVVTKSTLLQIVRQPTDDEMLKMAEAVTREQMTREQARARRKAANGDTEITRPHVYKIKLGGQVRVQVASPSPLDAEDLRRVLTEAASQN